MDAEEVINWIMSLVGLTIIAAVFVWSAKFLIGLVF